MEKLKSIDIEDSNIANYGGKDHQDAKEAKAQSEKEYKGAGQKVGLEIWRIENFGVKKWPVNQHGKFYSGDSYIVLNTYKADPKAEKLSFNAHFWLGAETSQDESGTAAFKVVELDDLLGDMPVQYREVQGFETPEFLKCFNGQVTLLKGGVDSAFNKVTPEKYNPRLLHFKKSGKNVRVLDVDVSCASLNHGDVFVLDLGNTLVQWNGNASSAWEKRKAMEFVSGLKGERGKAQGRVIDAEEEDDKFWTALGGKTEIAAPAEDVPAAVFTPTMYQISDSTGHMVVTPVATGTPNIQKSLLNTDDVFLLDIGHQIYVWVGKGCTKKERSHSVQVAAGFLKQTGRPQHTPITRIGEGQMCTGFNQEFAG